MHEPYTQMVAADSRSAAAAPVRLGGMALRNGILVHSLDHWAAAVRAPSGEIRLASGRKPELPAPLLALPGVRGVVRMAEAVYLLPLLRRRLPEARLPFESPGPIAGLTAAVVVGRVLRGRVSPLTAELVGAGLSLVPAMASLRGSRLARYHGAEHIEIGGYERGESAAEAGKEHERCGSHLVAPMLAATVAGNVLLARLRLSPTRQAPARLAVALGSIAVAVETFGWMQRNRGSRVERALSRPGLEMQRLVATEQPTGEELEVARAALAEVLRLEGAEPA